MSILMDIVIVQKVIGQVKPDIIIIRKRIKKTKWGFFVGEETISILEVFLFIAQSYEISIVYYDNNKKDDFNQSTKI